MNKPQINLQDVFLNHVRKESIPVTIYLIGGIHLRGMVRGFDAFTILLDSEGKPTQLVYKHAVASIVPTRPVANFYAESHREGAESHREIVESGSAREAEAKGALEKEETSVES
ncbi:MAG: RNA chaperone Hfq [Armatimonadetes bacterium]|nr:RNA chaperone Hfq [Armatimonadota bacterium]